jgi:hypothetical protein
MVTFICKGVISEQLSLFSLKKGCKVPWKFRSTYLEDCTVTNDDYRSHLVSIWIDDNAQLSSKDWPPGMSHGLFQATIWALFWRGTMQNHRSQIGIHSVLAQNQTSNNYRSEVWGSFLVSFLFLVGVIKSEMREQDLLHTWWIK